MNTSCRIAPERCREDIGSAEFNPRSDDVDHRKNVQSCDYTTHVYSRLRNILNRLRREDLKLVEKVSYYSYLVVAILLFRKGQYKCLFYC